MNHSTGKTAILFFSRTAHAEARLKHWSNGADYRTDLAIATALIDKTLSTLHKTGLEIIHFHEGFQSGVTFGERLSNAYQSVYNQGFDQIIAVGNDSPDLGKLDWNAIISSVQQGNPVIGSTLKGGTYLIGLNRSQFQQLGFATLPWESPRIYRALKEEIEGKTTEFVKELQVLADLNSGVELRQWADFNAHHSFFARKLKQILGEPSSGNSYIFLRTQQKAIAFNALRGPPTL